MAAFAPMWFVPGVSGKFFRILPAVVVAVLVFSLIELFSSYSLTFTVGIFGKPADRYLDWLNIPSRWVAARLTFREKIIPRLKQVEISVHIGIYRVYVVLHCAWDAGDRFVALLSVSKAGRQYGNRIDSACMVHLLRKVNGFDDLSKKVLEVP